MLLNRERKKTKVNLNITVCDFLSNSYIFKDISEEVDNNMFWSFQEKQIQFPEDLVYCSKN